MELVLSVLALLFLALVGGAIYLWRRGGSRKQIVLMLVLAAVVAGDIAIWTVPDSSGQAPIARDQVQAP